MSTQQSEAVDAEGVVEEKHRPRYFLNIEGEEYKWHDPTITVAELRVLAGWPTDQEVVLVDLRTNEEHALDETVPIKLKHGHGFGRKFKFKRGKSE